MTDYDPDAHVVGVDVSVSHAYLSRVYRDGRTPDVHMIKFPALDEARDSNMTRAVEIADRNAMLVVAAILGTDDFPATVFPSMVCFSKLFVMDQKSDPTGTRRAALWWNVSRMVHALRFDDDGENVLPDALELAEVPPMTAQQLLAGRAVPGRSGFTDSDRAVRVLYPDIEDVKGFRYYTVGQAMCGAVALGWSVPATVTNKALSSMRGISASFPMEIPRYSSEWEELNAPHCAAFSYKRSAQPTPKGA